MCHVGCAAAAAAGGPPQQQVPDDLAYVDIRAT